MTDSVSVARQVDASYEVRGRFKELKGSCVRMSTSAFGDGEHEAREVSFTHNADAKQ